MWEKIVSVLLACKTTRMLLVDYGVWHNYVLCESYLQMRDNYKNG